MDDIFGANFVSGTTSGDPYDDNGHGTFVAGVVGAVGNNKIGISGVSQVASIVGERVGGFDYPTDIAAESRFFFAARLVPSHAHNTSPSPDPNTCRHKVQLTQRCGSAHSAWHRMSCCAVLAIAEVLHGDQVLDSSAHRRFAAADGCHPCMSAACKFMDASGNGWISDAIRCYDYCTNADTQVISNSWGVYESSAALQVCVPKIRPKQVLTLVSNSASPLT